MRNIRSSRAGLRPAARRILASALALGALLFSGTGGIHSSGSGGDAGAIIPGEFQATPSGGAAFQIPIEVPPGIQKLQPQLSLTYNSQSRSNGVLGIGWRLGGLSSIERCGKARPTDATSSAVNGSVSDRLCLDGMRLLPRSAGDSSDFAYWAAGSYSKEIEDFSEVVPGASCGTGPCEFTVTTRDGRVMVYGGASNAQVDMANPAGGALEIRQWLLREIRDSNGNAIQHVYASGGAGTKVIQSIEYDGRSVDFQYDTRNDARDVIFSGDGRGTIRADRLLRRIRVSTLEGEYKRYELSYERSQISARSRLAQVLECGASLCRDPIRMSWNDEPSPDGRFRLVQPAGEQYRQLLRFDPGAIIIPGDYNGDGRTDFIRQERGGLDNDRSNNFNVYFSRGDGYFDIVTPADEQYQHWLRFDPGANIIPGDFNGDGKTDFIRQERGGWDNDRTNTFNVYFSRGDGQFDIVTPAGSEYQRLLRFDAGVHIIPGDFNGDGKTDFLRQEKGDWDNDNINTFNVYFSRGDGYFDIVTPEGAIYQTMLRFDRGANIIPGDFNGDGMMDFLRQEKHFWDNDEVENFQVYFSKGDGYFNVVEPAGAEYQWNLRHGEGVALVPADLNGDGKADFIATSWEAPMELNGREVYYLSYLSRGDGSFDIVDPAAGNAGGSLEQPAHANVIPLDYNGDGRTDFIRQERDDLAQDYVSSFQVYVSRGDGRFDRHEPADERYQRWLRDIDSDNRNSGGVNIIPGDYDGDGRTDFIRQPKGAWETSADAQAGVFFAAAQAGSMPHDTVARIDQGSVSHDFEYRRLTDYQPNAGRSFPDGHIGVSGPHVVLLNYKRGVLTPGPDGIYVQFRERRYQFLGATYATNGRGFQGFQEMRVSESDGESTASESYTAAFHVVYPLSRQPSTVDLKSTPGMVDISRTTFDWESVPGVAPGSVQPRLKGRLVTTYEADGAQTNSTSLAYDNFGNVILAAEDDGGRTLYTCSQFENDASARRPGPMSGQTQSTSCSVSGDSCSCDSALSKTRRTFDSRRNPIAIEKYDSSRDDWLREERVYDSRGNVVRSEEASGAVTEIRYDSAYSTYPVSRTLRADGNSFTESMAYDPRSGQAKRIVDPNGNATVTDYDEFGRVVRLQRVGPQGLSTVESHRYERNAQGLYVLYSSFRQSWDDADGKTQTRIQDGLGRIVEESSGSGPEQIRHYKRYKPDGTLRRISNSHRADEYPRWTTYLHNLRGQVSYVIMAGNRSQLTYGYGGVCEAHERRITTTISGGSGRHTVRCESARGQTRKLVMSDSASGKSTTQTYAYDALDRLIGVVDGNATTSFELDSLGRKTRTENTDRGTIEYVYGAHGQLEMERSNGEERRFTYDSLLRETRIDYHDGSHALFEYDDDAFANAQGRLTRQRKFTPDDEESSRREYSYDAEGSVAVMTLSVDGRTYATGYARGPQGRAAEVRFPDGKRACYRYDADGFLAEIRVVAGGACGDAAADSQSFVAYSEHSAEGRPARVEYGNGVRTDREFDQLRRLKSATTLGRDATGANTTLMDQRYTWTGLGEMEKIEDRVTDQITSYAYDGLGYLVRATGVYGEINYEYNGAGNMTRKGDRSLSYTGNRPTGASDGLSLEYDLHGNVIRRTKGDGTVYDFEYNGVYKIERVSRDGVLAGSYEYDAGGQRVKKLDGYGIETIYASDNLEITRYPDGKEVVTRYIAGPEGRIGAISTEDSGQSSMLGASAAAGHSLQAQMYNTASVFGAAGFLKHTIAAAVANERNAVALRALFWILCTTAFASLLIAQLVRNARKRGIVGRLRSRLAWSLADLGYLPEEKAASLATGGRSSAYASRRRRLLLPAPIMAAVMLSFALQCGSSSGNGAAPIMLAPGNEVFAYNQLLGPGNNGYGYAEAGTFYFQQDQVGSTSLVTDAEGKLVANTVYMPYGEVYQEASEGRDIYRSKFNGNEWDRDAEMYYFNARYYDPTIGSFLQADSLLFGTDDDHAARLNCYAFSANNPILYSDPSGYAALVTLAFSAAIVAGKVLAKAVVAGLVTGAITAGLYAFEAGIRKEFEWRELGIRFGVGVAAGMAGSFVAQALLGLSTYGASMYMQSVTHTMNGGLTTTVTRAGYAWYYASKVAYVGQYVLGGAVTGFANSAIRQRVLEGQVDYGEAGIHAGISAAIGGLRAGAGLLGTADASTPGQRMMNFLGSDKVLKHIFFKLPPKTLIPGPTGQVFGQFM